MSNFVLSTAPVKMELQSFLKLNSYKTNLKIIMGVKYASSLAAA